jgi:hypothetical protein
MWRMTLPVCEQTFVNVFVTHILSLPFVHFKKLHTHFISILREHNNLGRTGVGTRIHFVYIWKISGCTFRLVVSTQNTVIPGCYVLILTLLVLTTYLLAICIYSRAYHNQNKVHVIQEHIMIRIRCMLRTRNSKIPWSQVLK